jgi:hypothetical protein
MRTRAAVGVLSAALAATAALPGGAAGSGKTIKPLDGRYARCAPSAIHEKNINGCVDVLEGSKGKVTFDFQVKRNYCAAVALQAGNPGVWSLYPEVTFRHNAFTQKYTYDSESIHSESDANEVQVAFTLKGRFTSRNSLTVQITGKVTLAGSTLADCKGVSIKETHVLKHVNF